MEFTLSIGVARKPLDISWSHLPWQLGSSWHGSQKALRRWKNSWRVWSTSPAAWSHPRSKKVPGRWCTTCWHLSETWKLPDKAHSSPLITTHHHSSLVHTSPILESCPFLFSSFSSVRPLAFLWLCFGSSWFSTLKLVGLEFWLRNKQD